MVGKVRTCLWFESDGEKAAEFADRECAAACARRATAHGRVDVERLAVSGAERWPARKLDEAASISVVLDDQAETDRLCSALIADGGEESRRGWLRDRFGLSWQIVPAAALRSPADPAPGAGARVMEALMPMRRTVIAELDAVCS